MLFSYHLLFPLLSNFDSLPAIGGGLPLNYFYPSKKIIAKTRDENGRTHKKYDRPKTPFTRSLEFANENSDGHITKDDVEKMQQTKQSLNIIALQCEVTELQEQLFKLAKRWN